MVKARYKLNVICEEENRLLPWRTCGESP